MLLEEKRSACLTVLVGEAKGLAPSDDVGVARLVWEATHHAGASVNNSLQKMQLRWVAVGGVLQHPLRDRLQNLVELGRQLDLKDVLGDGGGWYVF